jgi:hypothetical protein
MGTPTLPFRGKNPYILTGCSITPFVMGGPVTPALQRRNILFF